MNPANCGKNRWHAIFRLNTVRKTTSVWQVTVRRFRLIYPVDSIKNPKNQNKHREHVIWIIAFWLTVLKTSMQRRGVRGDGTKGAGDKTRHPPSLSKEFRHVNSIDLESVTSRQHPRSHVSGSKARLCVFLLLSVLNKFNQRLFVMFKNRKSGQHLFLLWLDWVWGTAVGGLNWFALTRRQKITSKSHLHWVVPRFACCHDGLAVRAPASSSVVHCCGYPARSLTLWDHC